jgi:hypothetical protein
MPLDLRPLTLAELLDRSFSTYKRHLWLFVGIMAVPAAIAMAMAIVLRIFGATPPAPGTPPAQVLRQMLPFMVGFLAFLLVYLLVHTFALGATAIAVSELYLGREITIAAAYRRVRPNAVRLVLLCLWGTLRMVGAWTGLVAVTIAFGVLAAMLSPILAVLAFPIGFIGTGVITVFMTTRYGVSVPVVVIEEVPAGAGLRRSVELTRGNLGRVFLMILCAVIVTYATALIFQGPFTVASLVIGPGRPLSLVVGIVGAIVGSIGGMFSGPLMIIGLALMYYDLRIRKEALDLQLLLEHADAARQS